MLKTDTSWAYTAAFTYAHATAPKKSNERNTGERAPSPLAAQRPLSALKNDTIVKDRSGTVKFYRPNKFAPFFTPKDGGRHAEVPGEATLVRPLPVKALEQRLAQREAQGIAQ